MLRRPWRIAFVVYALVLTTATHWPQLQLPPSAPTSDKMLHMLAFGLLTLALWRTQWVRSRWMCVVIALVWSMLDEWSQAIPALNRWNTLDDAAANAMGVLTVGAWLWAMRPIGAEAMRMRTALRQYAADCILSRKRIWIITIVAIAACGVIAAALWNAIEPRMMQRVLLGLAGIVPIVVWIGGYQQWTPELKRLKSRRPCFACGTPSTGGNTCQACGGGLHDDQWTEMRMPGRAVLLRAVVVPVLVITLIVGGVFGLVMASPTAYAWMLKAGNTWSAAPRAVQAVGRAERSMLSAVDLMFYLLVFALATRLYRRGLARHIDQAVRCRRCGHDLRGSPVDEAGHGICPECGVSFATAPTG